MISVAVKHKVALSDHRLTPDVMCLLADPPRVPGALRRVKEEAVSSSLAKEAAAQRQEG